MDTPIETIEQDGYTISIYYDEDCLSPRDSDGNFHVVEIKGRRGIDRADDVICLDDGYDVECKKCDGFGTFIDTLGCENCEGQGYVYLDSLEAIAAHLKQENEARVILPIDYTSGYTDRYTIGEYSAQYPWSSSIIGFIMDTPEVWDVRGEFQDMSVENITRAMKDEIDEHSKWAEGDCYGYIITDVNGNEVDACWGFIGMDYIIAEAKAVCPTAPVESLISVTMTRKQCDLLLEYVDAPWLHDIIEQALESAK